MNDRGHLSAPELDLLQLGTLPAEAEPAARAHLTSCARCQARAAEQERARERFEAIRAGSWAAVEARAAPRGPARWLLRLAAPLAAISAAAALLLLVVDGEDRSPRAKGAAALKVYALHEGRVREVQSGDRVAPGDRIRFVAECGAASHLLVLAVDGAGKAMAYVPFDGDRSVALAAGRTELPDSVELDATPGPERLFVFFSDRPLEAAPLREALARRPRPDAVGEACAAIELRKEVR